MNDTKTIKLRLIRHILAEARRLTDAGYGKIAFECEIVEKQPEGDIDYDE